MPLPLPFFSDIWQQRIRPNINHMAAVRMASRNDEEAEISQDLDDLKVSPFPKIKNKVFNL